MSELWPQAEANAMEAAATSDAAGRGLFEKWLRHFFDTPLPGSVIGDISHTKIFPKEGELHARTQKKPKIRKSGPGQRSQPALSSKQVAKLLRDKYLQQLDQRRLETDSTKAQASGQAEDAGSWAVDGLTAHCPTFPPPAGAQYQGQIPDHRKAHREGRSTNFLSGC